MSHAPAEAYRRRLAQRREAYETLSRIDARFSFARLATFGALLLVAGLAWRGSLPVWSLAVPVVFFGVLVVRHDRVVRARDAAARAIVFYERGLARIEDRWIGTGEPGERFRDEHHLYANDLDLFGHGSLFELLSLARTRAGEETLAGWLKTPATREEVHARHEAVRELTPALDLREALSLSGTEVRAGVDGDALMAWGEAPVVLTPPALRLVAALITLATISAIALFFGSGRSGPMVAMLVLQSLFSIPMARRIERALHAASGPARDLDILSHLLERLERERFAAPRLAALRARLETAGVPASTVIHRLHRLVEMHDWQHNLIFLPVSLVLMWGTHIAWAIEAWRRRYGRNVRGWLGAAGELEALSSLSAYRYEHPDDPFPEIVPAASDDDSDAPDALPAAAGLAGVGLGHPLIPSTRMVRNDVSLSGATRLLIVSGSNMSGKSTLLRTVGVNAVLALAGAPVRAATMRLTPLAIGATLRIQDSLQEGRSRFYAEITRIRELSDVARRSPLLFLLDELLHGTNSHDRLVGASGILRGLIDRGAIGLVTTHDLALTAIADDLGARAANVHFEDWFAAGEIRFDYKMKAGPVARSNAIALMRAVGLEVEDEPRADAPAAEARGPLLS